MRVLVVEDEPRLLETLRRGLREEGFAVDGARTLAEAAERLEVNPYDLAVLDRGLPDGDGLDLLRRLRREGSRIPILVLTARDTVSDRVMGLDTGADDYLIKPFAFAELLARCRALARRGPATEGAVIEAGDVTVEPAARAARVGSQLLSLTAKELALLQHLARRPGRVFGQEELLSACWDEAYIGASNVLEVHIAGLRKKLRAAGSRVEIRALRNLGYRLET